MPSPALGYSAAAVAILFFGSNFLPVKRFNSGNGIYFCWVMCAAIWVCGMAYYTGLCVADGECPSFQPLAMLGGAIWCTGNLLCVPVIKAIGMGLGLSLWCGSSLLCGWASAHFGILGVSADPAPARPALQYAGVAIAALAILVFASINPSSSGTDSNTNGASNAKGRDEDGVVVALRRGGVVKGDEPHTVSLLSGESSAVRHDGHAPLSLQVESAPRPSPSAAANGEEDDASWVDALPAGVRKVVGVVLALFAGIFFGVNFNPAQYVANHPDKFPGASPPDRLADYAFAHFSGIFASATIYMLAYGVVAGNAPKLYPRITVPAMISGVMWAIAQISFFYANANIGQSISFPLISVGPSLVGALWGVFLLREISGKRNLGLLAAAFALAIAASTCIALSK